MRRTLSWRPPPSLVAAGYVSIDGESDSGYFWRFTEAGVQREEELGLLGDDELLNEPPDD
jgi:hypothetical protein